MKRQEAAQIAAAEKAQSAFTGNKRQEPNLGVPGDMLFSHGQTLSERYGAAMSSLHYTNPAQRGACGCCAACAAVRRCGVVVRCGGGVAAGRRRVGVCQVVR